MCLKNKQKNYLPDFIVDGEYVEIKGYDTNEWQAKLEHFPHKLTVLYENDVKKYINYAQTTYSKDFTTFYEKS